MKIIISEQNIEKIDILKQSVLHEHLFFSYQSELFHTLLNTINSLNTISHIGFIYHDKNNPIFPFFKDIEDDYIDKNVLDVMNTFKKPITYFNKGILHLIQYIYNKTHKKVIIDLISCNINEFDIIFEFHQIMKKFPVIIRYSLDPTGIDSVGGDWILESHGVNIKELYFNDTINNWDILLENTLHFGFITNTNQLFMFGDNTYGQLGISNENVPNTNSNYINPNKYTDVSFVIFPDFNYTDITDNSTKSELFIPDKVICGKSHTIVKSTNNKISVFGSNQFGQIDISSSGSYDTSKHYNHFKHPVYATDPSFHNIIDFDCGPNYTILLKEQSFYITGDNTYGLIHKTTSNTYNNTDKRWVSITDICDNITSFSQVSCGKDYFAIVCNIENSDVSNAVFFRGLNYSGQLGTNDNTDIIDNDNDTSYNMKICNKFISGNDKDNIRFVSCGSTHTCIITEKFNAYTTGSNTHGELCLNNTNNQNKFTKITHDNVNDISFAYASCGKNTTLLLRGELTSLDDIVPNTGNYKQDLSDNLVYAFGDNSMNQFSSNFYTNTNLITDSDSLKAISIYSGVYHSIIIDSEGYIKFFGNNSLSIVELDTINDIHRNNNNVFRIMNSPRFEVITYHHQTNHIAILDVSHNLHIIGLKKGFNNLYKIEVDKYINYNYDFNNDFSDSSFNTYFSDVCLNNIYMISCGNNGSLNFNRDICDTLTFSSNQFITNNDTFYNMDYDIMISDCSGYSFRLVYDISNRIHIYDTSNNPPNQPSINTLYPDSSYQTLIDDISNTNILNIDTCIDKLIVSCDTDPEIRLYDFSFNSTSNSINFNRDLSFNLDNIIDVGIGLYHLVALDISGYIYTAIHTEPSINDIPNDFRILDDFNSIDLCGSLIHRDSNDDPNILTKCSISNVSSISCGYTHTLCRYYDGNVISFGWNHFGQLGRPYDESTNKYSSITDISYVGEYITGTHFNNKRNITQYVSAGNYHSTLLYDDHTFEIYGLGFKTTRNTPYVIQNKLYNKDNYKYNKKNSIITDIPSDIIMINDVKPTQFMDISNISNTINLISNEYSYLYKDKSDIYRTIGVYNKGGSIDYSIIYRLSGDSDGKISADINDLSNIRYDIKGDNMKSLESTFYVTTPSYEMYFGDYNFYKQKDIATLLPNDIYKIYNTDKSFLAVNNDFNKIYTWGENTYSAINTHINKILERDTTLRIVDVKTTDNTFTILLNDGSRIRW
jgi:alpha-tubulin suppressor-like RCC1 family protein